MALITSLIYRLIGLKLIPYIYTAKFNDALNRTQMHGPIFIIKSEKYLVHSKSPVLSGPFTQHCSLTVSLIYKLNATDLHACATVSCRLLKKMCIKTNVVILFLRDYCFLVLLLSFSLFIIM